MSLSSSCLPAVVRVDWSKANSTSADSVLVESTLDGQPGLLGSVGVLGSTAVGALLITLQPMVRHFGALFAGGSVKPGSLGVPLLPGPATDTELAGSRASLCICNVA